METIKELTLHVGLPKTATTTLQTHIFPQLPGYLGKSFGPVPRLGQSDDLSRFFKDWAAGRDSWREFLESWVESLLCGGETRLLLSNEGLSSWPSASGSDLVPFQDSWHETTRTRPHPMTEVIAAVQSFGGHRLKVRAIVTVRNQPDFMGSRYAGLQWRGVWRGVRSPSQADFETKVADSLRRDDPFFDWAALVKELRSTVGEEDLLVLVHEDGIERNVSLISEFLGLPLQAPNPAAGRENVRRVGKHSWKGANAIQQPLTKRGRFGTLREALDRTWPKPLRRLKRPLERTLRLLDVATTRLVKPRTIEEVVVIEMPVMLARDVRNHFAESNGRLERMLGRDLKLLGY